MDLPTLTKAGLLATLLNPEEACARIRALAPIVAILKEDGLEAEVRADPWLRLIISHGEITWHLFMVDGTITVQSHCRKPLTVQLADPSAFGRIADHIKLWSQNHVIATQSTFAT